MKQQVICIELLEDTVISATSATVGAHHSLDYIPGATLLGAAAAQLYGQLGKHAFEVFHGNAARFSDGLPLVAGRIAWPVPMSWHEKKFKPARSAGTVSAEQIVNLAIDERPRQDQIKQLRDAYIEPSSGRWIKASLRVRMKTALQSGSAKEGALFGYEALPAGSRFLATITARDEQLLGQLVDVFRAGILIGRSRSAEYGRARIELAEHLPSPVAAIAPGEQVTVLYLAGDLCLLDQNSQPCLAPEGSDLGLEGARLVPERSFLRTRRYAPWNAYRRHHDMERQVISRGSVLTLVGEIDSATLDRLERKGLGLYRNQGLGRVLINPDFVVNPKDTVGKQALPAIEPMPAQRPTSPLIQLLMERAGRGGDKAGIARQAEVFCRRLLKTLKDARLSGGLLDTEEFGPSASQWNKFRDLYRQDLAHEDALLNAIFGPDIGIARPDHQNWKEKVWIASEQLTIADWFNSEIKQEAKKELVKNAARPIDALRQLVIETAILMAKEEARR